MPDASTLPSDLRSAIDRAGYYPALVADVVDVAVGGESVMSHLVHQETTLDADAVRRHATVLVLTASRLIVAHVDDHAAEAAEGDDAGARDGQRLRHGGHRVGAALGRALRRRQPRRRAPGRLRGRPARP